MSTKYKNREIPANPEKRLFDLTSSLCKKSRESLPLLYMMLGANLLRGTQAMRSEVFAEGSSSGDSSVYSWRNNLADEQNNVVSPRISTSASTSASICADCTHHNGLDDHALSVQSLSLAGFKSGITCFARNVKAFVRLEISGVRDTLQKKEHALRLEIREALKTSQREITEKTEGKPTTIKALEARLEVITAELQQVKIELAALHNQR